MMKHLKQKQSSTFYFLKQTCRNKCNKHHFNYQLNHYCYHHSNLKPVLLFHHLLQFH